MAPAWGGFTLVELLIVMSIFVLLLAIAVPAFSSMMYSSEQSMAENALRGAVGAGRDAAIKAGPGRDGAVLFIFADERIAMVACVRAGTLDDEDPTGGTETVAREVFAPVPGFEPVRLPKGWMVRGYATPGMIDAPGGNGLGLWYESNPGTPGRDYPVTQGNWVFPETGFYDPAVPPAASDAGKNRQSFMLRFEGGTGILKSDSGAVLVLFPGGGSPSATASFPWDTYRADQEADGARFVARVKGAPLPPAPGGLKAAQRWALLGDRSVNTVLVKAVSELALYNERKLAASPGLGGARLDPITGCLYMDPSRSQWRPAFVGPSVTADAINAWCEGWDKTANPPKPVETDCRLFTVQRYLGTLQEVSGTRNAGGVTQ